MRRRCGRRALAHPPPGMGCGWYPLRRGCAVIAAWVPGTRHGRTPDRKPSGAPRAQPVSVSDASRHEVRRGAPRRLDGGRAHRLFALFGDEHHVMDDGEAPDARRPFALSSRSSGLSDVARPRTRIHRLLVDGIPAESVPGEQRVKGPSGAPGCAGRRRAGQSTATTSGPNPS